MNITIIPNNIMLFFLLIYFVALDLASVILPGGPGRYLLLGALVGIFLGYCLKNKNILRLKINRYSTYLLLFTIFTYLSSFWAINSVIARYWASDFFGIFLMMTIIYICCKDTLPIDSILLVVMYGGYIISISAIIYYGTSWILFMITNALRVSNDFLNANVLGMAAAFSMVIHFYFFIYKKAKWWWIFFIIPCIMVLLVASSRKAIVVLLFGIFMILVLNNLYNKDKLKGMIKSLLVVVLSIIVVLIIAKQFSETNIYTRTMGLINGLLGNENIDGSTQMRFQLIEMGKVIFRKNPILGIGMDNAKLIVLEEIGRKNFYLHNNYIELLADGGIVGFVTYYWIYIVLIYQMIKYRNFNNPEYNICLVLLTIWLVMDYGMVTYLSKRTYFYLMILSIAADRFENEAKQLTMKLS